MTLVDKSDQELIAEYLGGRAEAFTELTKRHLAGVYSFALRFVGSAPDAEDIAQETFLKAWRSLKKYRPETSLFKTWLMTLARNTAIDFLRKRKNVPFSHFENEKGNVLAETVADPAALSEELFAQGEDAVALNKALAQLTPAHREIVLLYYTNDFTFDEIGKMLGEPANTIKSRHRRALAALKQKVHQNDAK